MDNGTTSLEINVGLADLELLSKLYKDMTGVDYLKVWQAMQTLEHYLRSGLMASVLISNGFAYVVHAMHRFPYHFDIQLTGTIILGHAARFLAEEEQDYVSYPFFHGDDPVMPLYSDYVLRAPHHLCFVLVPQARLLRARLAMLEAGPCAHLLTQALMRMATPTAAYRQYEEDGSRFSPLYVMLTLITLQQLGQIHYALTECGLDLVLTDLIAYYSHPSPDLNTSTPIDQQIEKVAHDRLFHRSDHEKARRCNKDAAWIILTVATVINSIQDLDRPLFQALLMETNMARALLPCIWQLNSLPAEQHVYRWLLVNGVQGGGGFFDANCAHCQQELLQHDILHHLVKATKRYMHSPSFVQIACRFLYALLAWPSPPATPPRPQDDARDDADGPRQEVRLEPNIGHNWHVAIAEAHVIKILIRVMLYHNRIYSVQMAALPVLDRLCRSQAWQVRLALAHSNALDAVGAALYHNGLDDPALAGWMVALLETLDEDARVWRYAPHVSSSTVRSRPSNVGA